MKIHRFIGQWQLAHGNVRIDDADLAHQVRKVLKLQPGETIILGDGTGTEAQCTILAVDRSAVTVTCTAIGRNANELQAHLILYCSVLKHEHFQEAAAMATQIGVREIVPIRSARTVKLNLRTDRVEKVIRESAELAGRGVVPALGDIVDFDGALTHAHRNDANLFLDPSGKPLTKLGKGNKKVGIFIGPEGGWEEGELHRAGEYGLRMISLGPLILRAPVAAAVGTYLVLHALGNH